MWFHLTELFLSKKLVNSKKRIKGRLTWLNFIGITKKKIYCDKILNNIGIKYFHNMKAAKTAINFYDSITSNEAAV